MVELHNEMQAQLWSTFYFANKTHLRNLFVRRSWSSVATHQLCLGIFKEVSMLHIQIDYKILLSNFRLISSIFESFVLRKQFVEDLGKIYWANLKEIFKKMRFSLDTEDTFIHCNGSENATWRIYYIDWVKRKTYDTLF